ncbi:alpha/beta hydrolase [Paenirhodobacter sp.]|uniref:alpha/beta hydrolase n=1 Tax=Paenirhodobacter sp. TaxID=1965326 RepID=UPI003B3EE238
MDYDRLLDPEIRAFIAETEGFTPPGLDPDDWVGQRAAYDRMAAHFHAGRPPVEVRDERIGTVPVRRYGAGATVLYLHGGGFVLGGLDSHDDICAEIAARVGCAVVSVDYRLGPEHPHPAAYDDAAQVARALGPVVLCGDSAGATLCAALAGTFPKGSFLAQVLIYPLLGYPPEGGSFDIHAHAPLLSRDEVLLYDRLRGAAPDDPRHCPAKGNLADLPPTWLFPAEADPLHDDALRYAEASGARVVEGAGLVHGWLRARHRSARAGAAFDRIIAVLSDLAGPRAA